MLKEPISNLDGGAAMNAIIKTEVAVNKVGIIKTPNHPMSRRFSVLVIQLQKRPQRRSLSRLSKIAVMVKSLVYLIIRDSQAHKFSK
jgi:hypothetical protein